jgi:hypothetical protein
MRCLQEGCAELELPRREERPTGTRRRWRRLAGRTKRDSLLTVLQRSMDSADRVTWIQLPFVHVRREAEGQSQEWERDPRCPKRRKENCANDGEWMLAMRDDVGMRMRG